MNIRASHRRRQRGSLLIVAMIVCSVIGISLASYIQLSRSSLSISNRALYNNAAMNLAENGLEEAMYSINKRVADETYNWTNWTPIDTTNARRKLPASGTYQFDQNATGMVRVYVYNYLGSVAPVALARATVTLGGGTSNTIEKWVVVNLRKTSKFANGLVAKESITFSGNNASVDSWNSDPDNDGLALIPYSAGVRHDRGSVGSISVAVNAIGVNNADIWGYAATGGALPSVGSNGLVGPFGTASGTMNPNNVSTDFSASFDPVSPPATAGYPMGAITIPNPANSLELPRAADVPAADGKYYYTATEINFQNKSLNIQKKTPASPAVTVIITCTSVTTSIDIGGGSGALNIETGSKLEIYAAGDVKIAGQGAMNGGTTAATANQPAAFQIWGTKTSGVQDIQIAGNGVLSAVVYAPQASVKINGNGDVCGSVVANDITLVGNAAFHYDESLGNFGGGNPYRVSRWRELTNAADRAAFSSILSW